jgi:hypothetical protein
MSWNTTVLPIAALLAVALTFSASEAQSVRNNAPGQARTATPQEPGTARLRQPRGYLPPQAEATGGPGTCGAFMYWKDGQCISARDKRPVNEPIYKF